MPNNHPSLRKKKMYTGLWGPATWDALSFAALAYSSKRAKSFRLYLEHLFQNLPCEQCSVHATKYHAQHVPDYEHWTAEQMYQWVVDFHNAVNVRTGKPVMSTKDARKALVERSLSKDVLQHEQRKDHDSLQINLLREQVARLERQKSHTSYELATLIIVAVTLLLVVVIVVVAVLPRRQNHQPARVVLGR